VNRGKLRRSIALVGVLLCLQNTVVIAVGHHHAAGVGLLECQHPGSHQLQKNLRGRPAGQTHHPADCAACQLLANPPLPSFTAAGPIPASVPGHVHPMTCRRSPRIPHASFQPRAPPVAEGESLCPLPHLVA